MFFFWGFDFAFTQNRQQFLDRRRSKLKMEKKISVSTVTKRMNRILAAYREQCLQDSDGASAVASTSSSSSISSTSSTSSTASTGKMEMDKAILNYAAQTEHESIPSDTDASDQSYSFDNESPPKRSRCKFSMADYKTTGEQKQQQPKRRRQPSRTVKRAAVKLTSLPSKRVQRKVTSTVTSNASPDRSSLSFQSSDDESNSPAMEMTIIPGTTTDDDDDDDVKNGGESDTDSVDKFIKSALSIKTTPKATCAQPI